MSLFSAQVTPAGNSPGETVAPQQSPARILHRRSISTLLGVGNIGAIYLMLLIIVIFSIWKPSTFPTIASVKQVLDENATIALAALAILVPLSTATFDLSFANTMSLSGASAAHFVVSNHMPVGVAMLLGILVGMIIGVVNGIVVVVLRVDSFIGTLGTGFLVQAFISYFTKDQPIDNLTLSGTFTSVSQHLFGGVVLEVWWALGLAILLWLFMEYSSTGRRLYATGFNPEAARLAGIKIDRLRFCSLLTSAALSGFAGVMLASSISSGSPSAGNDYLLPAFAASFVGATQFKRGRMNAWGTVIAVLMLGTLLEGLTLISAHNWVLLMFKGLILVGALALSSLQHRSVLRGSSIWKGGAAIWRSLADRRREPAPAD